LLAFRYWGVANAPLIARQAGLPLAQAWGGGMVAAVDAMRFVVPVPAAFARPNRKYTGRVGTVVSPGSPLGWVT
jgi:TnpA family transposase